MEYREFLQNKQKQYTHSGFSCDSMNNALFDWQQAVTRWTLATGRAGSFQACGLGKGVQALEWAQQVNSHTRDDVLMVAPLAVAQQFKREAHKFGYDVNLCQHQADVKKGINITNYERLEAFDSKMFGGVVLDESSILKSYMGKIKRRIIEMFEATPYKLSCTATPAPNDYMELLNQAEFLGVMKSSEALSIWFIADQTQSGKYKLKGHAAKSFWEWVSSWAICINDPGDIGYDNAQYILPTLHEKEVIIPIDEIDYSFQDGLLRNIGTSATEYHKEKRLTAKPRAKTAVDIVTSKNEQFIVWCYTNYEADLLKKYLPDATEVRGTDKAEVKERAAIDFVDGNIKVLISKPEIFGFGLNFQNCANMVFCGRDYSYESYYQALRRIYRFGQKKEVSCYSILGSTEQQILNVVKEKERKQQEMHKHMYSHMKDFQTAAVHGHKFKLTLDAPKIIVPDWVRTEEHANATGQKSRAI